MSLLLALALSAAASPTSSVGFALVVTNNRSLDLSRPDLHYADDDGAKYARLFAEAFGPDNVLLLTSFDAESRRLFPDWVDRARPPVLANLLDAVATIERRVAERRSRGLSSRVLVVFAGHGDIKDGMGFVELEDQRFTARDLDDSLIGRIGAEEIHLILDSCNSYFMLNPRKPGAKRWKVQVKTEPSLLEKHPHVGALISTSAEAVTYEWSELQSGIFSHEVRSALRGGADVDGDGRVSYGEVEAFVTVANDRLVNDHFRPHIFARGPSGRRDAVMLPSFGQPQRLIRVPAKERRRITLRDQDGTRILDVHKEAGTALLLRAPSGSASLYAYESTIDQAHRHRLLVRTLERSQPLEASPPEVPRSIARGEAPVFRALFEAPFGARSYAALAKTTRPPPRVPTFGVSRRDVDRLQSHLQATASFERDERLLTGWIKTMGGTAVGLMGTALIFVPGSQRVRTARNLFFGVGALSLGWGLYDLLSPSDSEDLYARFRARSMKTEAARAEALLETEALWEQRVDSVAFQRKLGAGAMIGLGALYAAGGAFALHRSRGLGEQNRAFAQAIGVSGLSLGSMIAAMGVYFWTVYRNPVERTWALYRATD